MNEKKKIVDTMDLHSADEKAAAGKKPLMSHDLPGRETVSSRPKPGGFLQTHDLEPGGKLKFSDGDFIAKFARPEDLAELRKVLEARIEARPKPPFYFKCTNAKCGWIGKMIRELEPETACLKCNRKQEKAGGFLKPLTSKKEIREYEEGVVKHLQEAADIAKKLAKHANQNWMQRVASGEFGK